MQAVVTDIQDTMKALADEFKVSSVDLYHELNRRALLAMCAKNGFPSCMPLDEARTVIDRYFSEPKDARAKKIMEAAYKL